MAPFETLLIQAQIFELIQLAAFQAARHGAFHDLMAGLAFNTWPSTPQWRRSQIIINRCAPPSGHGTHLRLVDASSFMNFQTHTQNISGAPTLVIIKQLWDTVPLIWSGVLDKIPNRNILTFV
jgi:hypothetical protein